MKKGCPTLEKLAALHVHPGLRPINHPKTMDNLHDNQPKLRERCQAQAYSENPLLRHHVEELVSTLERFYGSGHFSGPAKTLHDAAFLVAEDMRSGNTDQESGLVLIYNLTEMQVFICQVLEQYQAIKGLTSNLAKS